MMIEFPLLAIHTESSTHATRNFEPYSFNFRLGYGYEKFTQDKHFVTSCLTKLFLIDQHARTHTHVYIQALSEIINHTIHIKIIPVRFSPRLSPCDM